MFFHLVYTGEGKKTLMRVPLDCWFFVINLQKEKVRSEKITYHTVINNQRVTKWKTRLQ